MNEQQITDMLERADASSSPPARPDPALADRAIRRAGRRATLRRVGVTVLAVDAVAAIAAFTIWLAPVNSITPSHPLAPGNTPASVYVQDEDPESNTQINLELAGLREQIAVQEEVVRCLLATKDLPEWPTENTTGLLAEVQAQVDLAARRMVMTADRMERTSGQTDRSRRIYTDVLSAFPESAWATIARRRIDEQEHLIEPRSSL